MAKQYDTHGEVDKKFKWDLSFLLEGKTAEERLAELLESFKEIIKVKESKFGSSNAFLSSLALETSLSLKLNKFSNYISNSMSINVVDPVIAKLAQQFQYQFHLLSVELGPDEARFFEHAEDIAKWAKLPEFSDYKFSLENQLLEKEHKFNKVIEEFRSKQKRADGDFATVFSLLTNSEIDKGFATSSKGEKIEITTANLQDLLKKDDKEIRKSAYESNAKAYLRHKQSLSNLLFQHKKSEATYASLKKFPSTIESLIFGDRVPKELLTTLFAGVQANVPVLKKYTKAWERFYEIQFGEKPEKYDKSRDLIKPEVQTITPDEGSKQIIEAFKPFGDEYLNVVKKGLEENWVDFYVIKNKRAGAYSIGRAHGLDKMLILMNWDDTSRSVETLAHEFGHSMHSWYSTHNNSPTNSAYKIFVAEIASIFNELMLFDFWSNESEDDLFKFQVLSQQIKGFVGTVFRQVEWANYEFNFYEALDKGAPLNTYEAITSLYYENAKIYTTKDKFEFEPNELFSAVTVPHFYYGFYVYKYAIGQLVANIFFQKYKENGKEALQTYIKQFLSVGGRKNPIDILKDAGVDLLDPSIYDLGFKAFETNVNEWIRLGEKIFKK